jgi:polysaccharide export outer membrane protein
MDTRPTYRRWHCTLLAGFIALAGGCLHTEGVVIPPPPDGAVPTELNPVILPRYVIAPPDILYVQVLQAPYTFKLPRAKEPEAKPEVKKEGAGGTPAPDTKKEADTGTAEPPIDARSYFSNPLTPAPIDGQHVVQMDGTIDLGIYGSVSVAGLTTDQARERVRAFLLQLTDRKPDQLQVRVSVLAFNSKQYYVITDGAGYGEQVAAFPITGSETVLDAMARIGGLPQVASKRDIWVARRSPNYSQDQILPVCWEDITQRGITRTNYQVLPGDRIYVKAQKLISFDNALAKVLQPIERMLGVTLLGSETVNSIKNRTGTGTTTP